MSKFDNILAITKQERIIKPFAESAAGLPFDFLSRLLKQKTSIEFQKSARLPFNLVQKVGAEDVVRGVKAGVFRAGIVGFDTLAEYANAITPDGIANALDIMITGRRDIARCAFKLLFSKPNMDANDIGADDTVVTAYPNILKQSMIALGRPMPAIQPVSSGVEGYVGLPSFTDSKRRITAAFDLVETGGTAKANGLYPDGEIFTSYACAIVRSGDEKILKNIERAYGFRRMTGLFDGDRPTISP